MQIIQDLIPAGRRNRPGLPMRPRYITVHSTANRSVGANAKMHGIYLRGDVAMNAPVSWHYTVDSREIRQHLSVDENGWHAGDGYDGTGNRNSIGIEICENPDGNPLKALANAAWLCAHLRRLAKTVQHIVQHARWTGKACPGLIQMLPGGWSGFLELVDGYLMDAPTGPAVAVELPDGRTLRGELRGSTTWAELPAQSVWVPVREWAEYLGARVEWMSDGGVSRVVVAKD